MRRLPRPTLPTWCAALALAALLTWLGLWRPFSAVRVMDPVYLRLVCASPTAGTLRISLDEGHGYFVDRSPEYLGPLAASPGWVTLEGPLPPGRVQALRVEAEGVPEFRVAAAQLHTGSGRVLHQLGLGKAQPGEQAKLTQRAEYLSVRPAGAGNTASFTYRFTPPLLLPTGAEPAAGMVSLTFVLFFLVALALLRHSPARVKAPREIAYVPRNVAPYAAALTSWPSAAEFTSLLKAAAHARPKLTIALVALLSVVANTYPILFFGKSLVSPNTLAYLLYVGDPTIANAPHEVPEHGAGSDLGATMWQSLPYSVVESQALWKDGEWPLWNRYNSGGVSLLGQGLSMLGDPLHVIPLLAGGAWWAWDIKFLFAKALFAIGVGFCAWVYCGRLGASALVAASVVWIGFFMQRYNHPAYFGVCYAPWVLLPWLVASTRWRGTKLAEGVAKELLGARARLWLCAAGLVLANTMELASGTAKEASILLLGLNVTGFGLLLSAPGNWRERGHRLAPMLWANVLFLLLNAPAWLLFLDTLRHSVTVYDAPRAYQLQPGLLLAFFDGIFAQDFTRHERVTQPSLNFLILLGLLWGLWQPRKANPTPQTRILCLAAAGAAAFVFGIVPPAWIVPVPFLGKIEHIYNGFGCVLLVLLPILATPGLAACGEAQEPKPWRAIWLKVILSIGLLFALYLGLRQARPLSPYASYRLEPFLPGRFYLAYVPCLVLAALGWGWACRWRRESGSRTAGLVLAAICLFVFHFRCGLYGDTKFDRQVMNPRTGVELAATSPALDYVRRSLPEPSRVYGFAATFTPGYNALLGLEGICGPDALHNPYYQELGTAAGLRQVWGWRWVVDEATLARLRPLYDMLNLRYYLRELDGPAPTLPGLSLAAQSDLEVYESKTVWPRAFYTDYWVSYTRPAEFTEMLAKGDGRPFAALQTTQLPSSPASLAERQIIPAHDYHLTNNRTSFAIQAPRAGLVVLGETFEDNNFQVRVNGAPAEVVRVNHAFKGVFVSAPGNYRISFAYRPHLLTPALLLAATGLLLSCFTVAALLHVSGWRRRAVPVSSLPMDRPPLPHLT